MLFTTSIDGPVIRCILTPDRDLNNPVLCYSSMVPSFSKDGFKRLKSLGGYTELQLPNLQANVEFEITLAYENSEFAPFNRAWLPLGAYLRHENTVLELTSTQQTGVLPGAVTFEPGEAPPLLVCPQPASFQAGEGTVKVHKLQADDSNLQRSNTLTRRAGLGPFLSKQGIPLDVILDETIPSDGYRLEIREAGLSLFHRDQNGAFYGGITLATLIFLHKGELPCGIIQDAPRFEWRGQHLDCARHFYKVESILQLLDLMALLKMNRFHWHFSDDEAFRLELESLPGLVQTHFRGEGELLPGVFGAGSRSGGSYSKTDVKRIVDHATALGIEVMPEIEIPAHALALCRLYPTTRDALENGQEQSVQGYFKNVMNPAMPESWRIWHTIIDEISELFPCELIHLGGDELPPDTWHGSPAAQNLMQAETLKTTQDLQAWTMNKAAQYTVSKGKKPAGWEESTLGSPSIGNDALIFCWTGQDAGLKAARDGYRVVMMPGQKTYLDMAHTKLADDWGANWAAIISLEETINWDPVPNNDPKLEKNIIGIEGAFWSEFTTQDQEMEAMIAPRILGISTMAWQPKGSPEAKTLLGLREAYTELFRALDWDQA